MVKIDNCDMTGYINKQQGIRSTALLKLVDNLWCLLWNTCCCCRSSRSQLGRVGHRHGICTPWLWSRLRVSGRRGVSFTAPETLCV